MLNDFELVIATQDWHPANHRSFASNNLDVNVGDLVEIDGLQQIMWPDHCIQNSFGAMVWPNLNTCEHIQGLSERL